MARGHKTGGRQKGTPNKLTVGRRYVIHRGFSVDGALRELSKLLVCAVPDPEDRAAIGQAIDKYIHFREMASDAEKRLARVSEPSPPSPSPFDLPEPLPLLSVEDWAPDLLGNRRRSSQSR